ncbi:hypothetical protein Saro_0771 [Novosphingobium aromaticivorans DSM 12444]|uniref:Spore coat protein U domain-containing protein n=1 Tax=Novosphingobium aromaticivorans (strain ATCC 700278 / DSM 12444 / CCUG 56034 / CIP 105152 / NBRC 16084 / F199) TaxID=279238 RepID=Q2GAA6_NOVAD|nr:hypothetical protein [Novosphingobium aromaticivorans]ABD25217.1 hypothetical protein Saro_0771 [Novosphingobium aromaticivorans DSM 12444]SCX87026.1 hypothetical protein SAMN05660666_00102 [Novosphingobium aromaticivorans]
MKKIVLLAAVASAAAIASPAAAQATGSVTVTGSVADKCFAIAPISDTITLGELSLQTGVNAGTVDSAFSSNTGGLSRSFSVRCTTTTPTITVSALPLTISGNAGTSGGYTGTVHYTSTLTAQKAGGGADASAVYTTADSLPAATTTSVGDRLKNATNNVTVTVSNGTTTNGTDQLKAGSYSGSISITVSPV